MSSNLRWQICLACMFWLADRRLRSLCHWEGVLWSLCVPMRWNMGYDYHAPWLSPNTSQMSLPVFKCMENATELWQSMYRWPFDISLSPIYASIRPNTTNSHAHWTLYKNMRALGPCSVAPDNHSRMKTHRLLTYPVLKDIWNNQKNVCVGISANWQ